MEHVLVGACHSIQPQTAVRAITLDNIGPMMCNIHVKPISIAVFHAKRQQRPEVDMFMVQYITAETCK